ncbi:multiple ligand-binding protein 1 [uncultured Microscilla sp.]|uniref:multiple ligand-binding protein 1 n=1 Tax=uncultured Microscilla sp. TaxID=432653 RepID=UPI0026049BA2|nr:multiple ligand-binding protein 1 [uncultured Microscilla sp.]
MKATIANITRLGVSSLLMVLLVNTVSYAQRNKQLTAEQRTKKAVQRMTKNLGLSVAQITKVEEANLTFQRAREVAKTHQDQTAARAARKAYHAELKTILTRNQYTKFRQTQRN